MKLCHEYVNSLAGISILPYLQTFSNNLPISVSQISIFIQPNNVWLILAVVSYLLFTLILQCFHGHNQCIQQVICIMHWPVKVHTYANPQKTLMIKIKKIKMKIILFNLRKSNGVYLNPDSIFGNTFVQH